MLKTKKPSFDARKEKLKESMNNDRVKAFYVELPQEEFWKIKRWVAYNKTTLLDWLRGKISEVPDEF